MYPVKSLNAYRNLLIYRINTALKFPVIMNYPLAAYIDPTLFCQLQCPACAIGLKLGLRPPARLSRARYQALLDEIGPSLFHLNLFCMGEPLLHSEIVELIEDAKARHIYVAMSSNLSLPLSDAQIERLVRSGLDHLVVSCDGVTEEIYQYYRRGGNLALVRQNMLRVREARTRLGQTTPTIAWQFLAFQHNQHEIEDARSLYQDWGADTLDVHGAFMPFAPYDKGFAPATMPDYNVYHTANTYQERARRNIEREGTCAWLYGLLVMTSNGSVAPCVSVLDERNDFGVYEPKHGFRALWNNERFQQARALFTRRGRASNATTPPAWEGPCHQCVTPARHDDLNRIINAVARNLLQRTIEQGDLRAALALLTMGGPPESLVAELRIGQACKRLMLRWAMGVPLWTLVTDICIGRVFKRLMLRWTVDNCGEQWKNHTNISSRKYRNNASRNGLSMSGESITTRKGTG